MAFKGAKWLVAVLALYLNNTAHALPFMSLDPASMAMGGTGVGIARPGTAAFFNPALLSVTRDEDDFALELPIIGARVFDPADLEDQIDRAQTAVDQLDISIQAVESNPTASGNFSAVATNTTNLNRTLQNMDNQPLEGELGVGMAVGIPSKKFAFGLFFNVGAIIQFVSHYADANDLNALSADAQIIEDCRTNSATCQSNASNLTLITVDSVTNPTTANVLFDPNTDLDSTADLRGLYIGEVGIAVAKDFGEYSIGITPKYVRVDTYDYRAAIDDADSSDADADDYKKSYKTFNLDVGIARTRERWRFGAAIKDVLTKEFETAQKDRLPGDAYAARGGAITMKPRLRIGTSYDVDWAVFAADFDVTQNDSVGSGGDSQLLALGAEFDAWRVLQLRLGYRADLENSERSVPSAGLGLSIFGVHLDAAVAANSNEIGAALQFGLRF